MACFSFNKLWESQFDDIVSEEDNVQDLKINQLKLELHDKYEKDEKLSTNFEPVNNEHVINKSFLDKTLEILKGQISYIEKVNDDFKLLRAKLSVEEVSTRRAVKMTIQILYDKGLFDNYSNLDEVLKDFLFT